MNKMWLSGSLIVLLILGGCSREPATRESLAADPPSVQATLAPTDEPSSAQDEAQVERFARFEVELDFLRRALKIPGLSAAIVQDQELVWAKGFGYADLENQVAATPDTPFHLASVTKPVAATLVMQLVEEGALSLDDPVSQYGVELDSQGEVTVWHLLTHTSEGIPGTVHNYNGDRYGRLGQVIEGATGQSFRSLLQERILEPLGMSHTAGNFPGCDSAEDTTPSQSERVAAQVRARLAKPYQLDASYNIVEGGYPTAFSPAAGLMASVTDLARFDVALDQNVLLKEETKALMLTPAVSTKGDSDELRYGLGWYTQDYDDLRLLWHSGRWPPSVSALYLKVPDRNLTFIVLANTPNLTTPFPLGDGDVMDSMLALAFYREFVFPQLHGQSVPEVDWEAGEQELANQLGKVSNEAVRAHLERELWSYRMLYHSVGRMDDFRRLSDVHEQSYPESTGLSGYLASAADTSPEGERVELSQAELERFAGMYILQEAPDIPGDIPPQGVTLTVEGAHLIGCAPGDPSPLVLIPIGPARFRALGGPEGYIYFDIETDGEAVKRVTAWLTERIKLVYVPGDWTQLPGLSDVFQAAIDELNLGKALALLEQLETLGDQATRAAVQEMLAYLEWRVYDRPEDARRRLMEGINQGANPATLLELLGRIEIGLGNYSAAQEAAAQVLEVASTPAETKRALLLFARAAVEEALQVRLENDDPSGSVGQGVQENMLQETLVALRDMVEAEPGELLPSRLLLAAALLLDDGDGALLAWRSYYWVAPGQAVDSLLAKPYRVLQELLPKWQGSVATAQEREQLIQALADSRFYQEAALIALDPRFDGELAKEAVEVVAYARFLRSLEKSLDIYYRQSLTGQAALGPRKFFDEELKLFCTQVDCYERGDIQEAYDFIEERFGAVLLFGRSDSRDLYMGHTILDEERTVEQYGQTATVQFISLDNLVSHGIRSWLRDRLHFVGGFPSRGMIVEFRPFRAQLLLSLAAPALDPQARADFQAGTAQMSQTDERLAAENPYARLTSLNNRLLLRSLDALWAEVSESGLSGTDLRLAFLQESDNVWQEGPMMAHEGRHVIDFHLGITDNVTLEVDAKVAEVTFCRYPGIPLSSNVLHPGSGIHGHGDANLVITQGLVAWMEVHAAEIEDLDASRPLLPQLDLLTDEQLRTAARSLDPLAAGDA